MSYSISGTTITLTRGDTMAARVSITRLIQSICVIVRGFSIPKKGARKLVPTAAKLMVN